MTPKMNAPLLIFLLFLPTVLSLNLDTGITPTSYYSSKEAPFCQAKALDFQVLRDFSAEEEQQLFPEIQGKYHLLKNYFMGYLDYATWIVSWENDLDFYNGVAVDTNTMTLMKNEKDASMVYIGFGQEYERESPDSGNKIVFAYVIGFKRNELRQNSDWKFDFEIKTDDAVCYYCNKRLKSPNECKIEMSFGTWGARNKIKIETWVHKRNFISKENKYSKSYLYGGKIRDAPRGFFLVNVFLWLTPLCIFILSAMFHSTLNQNSHKNHVSVILYLLSKTIVNGYLLYSFVIFWVNQYFTYYTFYYIIAYPIIGLFFVIVFSSIILIELISLLEKDGILNDNSEKELNPVNGFLISFMLIFMFFIWTILTFIMLISTCSGTPIFLLPNSMHFGSFSSPSVYFTLPHISLALNIVTNIIACKPTIDCPLSMILTALYIAYLPFSYYGPTQWVEGYNSDKVIKFFIIQAILIVILSIQFFAMPKIFSLISKGFSYLKKIILKKCWRKNYKKFQRRIQVRIDSESFEDVCCYCTNKLSEPEVEQDIRSKKGYKHSKLDDSTFYQLNCTHKYHSSCFKTEVAPKETCLKCGSSL